MTQTFSPPNYKHPTQSKCHCKCLLNKIGMISVLFIAVLQSLAVCIIHSRHLLRTHIMTWNPCHFSFLKVWEAASRNDEQLDQSACLTPRPDHLPNIWVPSSALRTCAFPGGKNSRLPPCVVKEGLLFFTPMYLLREGIPPAPWLEWKEGRGMRLPVWSTGLANTTLHRCSRFIQLGHIGESWQWVAENRDCGDHGLWPWCIYFRNQ